MMVFLKNETMSDVYAGVDRFVAFEMGGGVLGCGNAGSKAPTILSAELFRVVN